MKIDYDSATEIGITIDNGEFSQLEREALSAQLASGKMRQINLPERQVSLVVGRVEQGQRFLDMADRKPDASPVAQGHSILITTITISPEGYAALRTRGLVNDRVGEITIGIYYRPKSANGQNPIPATPPQE